MKTVAQMSARVSCLLTFVMLVLSVRAGVGMPTTIPQLVNNQVEHTMLGMSTSTVSYNLPPIQDTETSAEALTPQTASSSYKYQAEFYKLVGAIDSLVRNATDWIKSASQQLYQWSISSEKKVARKFMLPVETPTTVEQVMTLSVSRRIFNPVRKKSKHQPLKFRGFSLLTETSNSPDSQIWSTRVGVGTSTVNYNFTSESAHGDDMSLNEVVGAFKEEIHKLVGDMKGYVQKFTIWIKTNAQDLSHWATQESAKTHNGSERKRVKKHALSLPKPTIPHVWKRVRLPRRNGTPVVEGIKMPPVKPRILMPPKLGMAVDSRLLGSAHLYVPPPSFISVGYKIHFILGVIVVFFICCSAAIFVGRKGKSKIIPGPYVLDGFYAYIITVRTSFKRYAGTNSQIKVQLFSNSSSSPEYVLPRNDQKVLSRGKEAMLLVYTKAPLGELTHVLVTLNGHGVKAKWHLTDLTVSDPWADREWYFANDKWLKPKHNGAAQTHTLPLTDVGRAYNLMWSALLRIVIRYHTWIYPVFGGGQEHAEVLSRPATLLLLLSSVGNFLLGNVLMETALITVGSHQFALHFSANTFLITFVVNAAICIANCVCEIFLGNMKSKKLCANIFDRVSAFQAHQERLRTTERNRLQAIDSSIDLPHSHIHDKKFLFSQADTRCYVHHEDEENLDGMQCTQSLCNIARESTEASSGKRRNTMFATTHALKLSKTEMIRKKLNLQCLSRIDVETTFDLPLNRSKSDTDVSKIGNKNGNNNTSNSSSASDMSDVDEKCQSHSTNDAPNPNSKQQENSPAEASQFLDFLSQLPPITPDDILFGDIPLPEGLLFGEVPLPEDGALQDIPLPQGIVFEETPLEFRENPIKKKHLKAKRPPVDRKRLPKKNKDGGKSKRSQGKQQRGHQAAESGATGGNTGVDKPDVMQDLVVKEGKMVILTQSDLDAGVQRQCMICKQPVESKYPYPYHWVCKFERAIVLRMAQPPVNGPDATLKQEADALYAYMKLPNPAVVNKTVPTFPKKRLIELEPKEQEMWLNELFKINPIWVDEKLDEVDPPKQAQQKVPKTPKVHSNKMALLTQEELDAGVRRNCLLCQKQMKDPYPIHWYCKYQKAVQLGCASAPANGSEATVYDTADALCDYMGIPRLAQKNYIKANDPVDDTYFPDVKLTELPQEEQQIWINKLLQINPLWAAKMSSVESGTGEPASMDNSTEEPPCEMQLPARNMKSELSTAILCLAIFKAPSTGRKSNPTDKDHTEKGLTLGNTEKKAAEFLNELIGDMVNMLMKDMTSAKYRAQGWQTKVFEFMTSYQKTQLQNRRKPTAEGDEGKDMSQNEEPDKHAPKMSLTEKLNRSVFDTRGFDTVVRRLSQEITTKTISEDLSDHENEWDDDLSDNKLQLNVTGEYYRQKGNKGRVEVVAQTGESLLALHLQPFSEPQNVTQDIEVHSGKFAPDLKPRQTKSGYVYGRSLTNLSASASVNHLKEAVPLMQARSKSRQKASLTNFTAQSSVQNIVAGTRPHLFLGELISKIIADDPDAGLNVFKMLLIMPEDITAESVKDLAKGTAHGLLASFDDMCDIATDVSRMAMKEFSNELVESLLQMTSTKLDADRLCSQSPSTCLLTNEETESQQPTQCLHHDIPSTHTIVGQVLQLMEKEVIDIRNDKNQMIIEAFTYHYLDALIFNAIIRAQHAILHQCDEQIQDQESQNKEQAIRLAQDLLHKDVKAFYNDNWETCKETVQLGFLALNKFGDVFIKEQELKESILNYSETVARNVAASLMKVVQMLGLPLKEHELPYEDVSPASSNESDVSSIALGDVMAVHKELKDCRNLLNSLKDAYLMSAENGRLLKLPKASRSLDSVVRSLSEVNKAMPCKKLSTSLPQVDRFEEMLGNEAFLSACKIAPFMPSGSKDVVIDIDMKQAKKRRSRSLDSVVRSLSEVNKAMPCKKLSTSLPQVDRFEEMHRNKAFSSACKIAPFMPSGAQDLVIDIDMKQEEGRSKSLDSVVRSLSEANKAMPCKKLSTSLPQVDRFEEMHRNKAFLSACKIAPSMPSGSKDVVIDMDIKQEEHVALDVRFDVGKEDHEYPVLKQPNKVARPLNDKELLHVEMMVKGEFKKRLPHWVKYIIFALLICSIAVSFFVTAIYGMSFEDESLYHWLLLVGLAILEDIIIFQPVKCLFIHFYFMVFPRHRNISNNPV